jgi:hypothetical protein
MAATTEAKSKRTTHPDPINGTREEAIAILDTWSEAAHLSIGKLDTMYTRFSKGRAERALSTNMPRKAQKTLHHIGLLNAVVVDLVEQLRDELDLWDDEGEEAPA